jgi:hypothetical protein
MTDLTETEKLSCLVGLLKEKANLQDRLIEINTLLIRVNAAALASHSDTADEVEP